MQAPSKANQRQPTPDLPSQRILGMMSGTSADGTDAVLAQLEYRGGTLQWEVLERVSTPYPPTLRDDLLKAMQPESSNVVLITQLHTEVGKFYADLAQQFNDVDLIAISGQTLYHIPRAELPRGWRTVSTFQVGEPAIVAERCGIPVLSDFRQSDMAAGGQGAPMVAFGDLKLYHRQGTARAVHNLGGISNLTFLPADGDPDAVFAFDTGPANCLIDDAMKLYFDAEYDSDGKIAASGHIIPDVLEKLMRHPYLEMPPPKTTGREIFRLAEFNDLFECQDPRDIVTTLTAFTAESIARAYQDFVLQKGLDEILLAGGGSLNPTLVSMLKQRLVVTTKTFDELGWNPRDREALAFAVMAYFANHGLPNTLPNATGAQHRVVAGKLSRPYPNASS